MVSSSPLWWIKNAMSPSFVQSSSNRARLGRRRRFRCARRGGRGCIDRHRNRRRWVGVGVAEGVEELGVSGWEDWGYGGCFVGGIGRWVRQPENGVEVVSGCFFLGGVWEMGWFLFTRAWNFTNGVRSEAAHPTAWFSGCFWG